MTSLKHLKKHRNYKTARLMILIRSENVVAAVGQRSYRPCAHGRQELAQEIKNEETSSRAVPRYREPSAKSERYHLRSQKGAALMAITRGNSYRSVLSHT